jgi:hypothetical protein
MNFNQSCIFICRKIYCITLWIALSLFVFPSVLIADQSLANVQVFQPPENLIIGLYKEYKPENINKLTEKQRLHLGLRFDKPEAVSRYFDETLTKLIRQEENCKKRTREICNLDFDPVLNAQDFDEATPFNLKMKRVAEAPVRYKVTFTNGGRQSLIYELRQTKNGWKISNIIYPEGHSLKKILLQK